MPQTSLNPRTDYPLWARCSGCMVSLASFPGFLIASLLADPLPWQLGILAAGLSTRGLSVLTCPRSASESFLCSVIRDALVARKNRALNESRSAEITDPQGSAGSPSAASGTKTAA